MQKQKDQEDKWDDNHLPFSEGYPIFAAISKEERSAYRKKVLQTEQIDSPPPIVFRKNYPNAGKLEYKGYQIHYNYIENTAHPKAILVHFHGLNSHGGVSGYYSDVIAATNKEMNVYTFDQLNFGQSQGPFRGQITSLDDSVAEGQAVVQMLLDKFDKKPKVFLSGSSYGSTIIFKMIVKYPQDYAGAVLITPGIKNLEQDKPFIRKLGKFLGWLIPRTKLLPQTFGSTTKYANKQNILADPYFYKDKVVFGSIRAVLEGIQEVSEMFHLFDCPYIIFQAGVDKSVDLFAGLDLEEKSPSNDKTTVYCSKMWHAAFSEEEIEGIAWQTAQWLKARI